MKRQLDLARNTIADALLAARAPQEALAATCRILQGLPGYTGVYLYALTGDTLELRAFQGRATEHTRIPAGKGICGASVLTGTSVIVPDVESDSRYLACNLETKSEIVVPIFRGNAYLAQIDVDSDFRHAFGAADESFLADIAKQLETLLLESLRLSVALLAPRCEPLDRDRTNRSCQATGPPPGVTIRRQVVARTTRSGHRSDIFNRYNGNLAGYLPVGPFCAST